MHLSSLRSTLTDAGFTVDAIDALWGAEAAAALHRGHRLPAIRAIDGRTDSLATLARLLVLGLPVPATDLPPLDGLVRVDGGIAHPLLDVRPYAFTDDFTDATGPASWFIASDLGETALGHKIPEGHVLGIGGASLTLSGLMIGRPVASVLDLGTGCGIQAMHAARHAARVVATDISARALELSALNLELNGIDGVELRLGSLYEPVAGERFDRIVSNPPFVITPRTEGVPSYEYRDGGMVGDALVEHVIRGAEDHLTSGGVAQLLGNWEYREGAQGLDRVRDWVAQTGLDAWVVERELQDPALYAETWIRDGGTRPGTAEFESLYAAWLDDFAARGVTGIGFGYVTLRRPLFPGTPRLRRFERVTHALGSGLGSSIAASLDAWDWLSVRSDAELAAACLTVATDVTEERHYWPGDEHPAVITLRQGGGFAREVQAGTALAAVVGASDGELTIGQICDAVAQLLEVDADELLGEVITEVRELVFTGMLVP